MKVEHTLDRLARMKQEKEVREAQAAKIEKNRFRKKEKTAEQGTPGAAKVNISPKAKELDRIKHLVKETDDNSEKIALLKKLIGEKKYDVPASDVADRMVDDHLKSELL